MRRGGVIGVGVLVFSTLLAGCTPAFRFGVRRFENGRTAVVSCGSFIDEVTVLDADTGRVVWATQAAHGGTSEEVTVGRPPPRWLDVVPFVDTSRPRTWSVRVGVGFEPIVVSESRLRSGRVFRPGVNQSESVAHFDDRTCGGPFSDPGFNIAVVSVIGVSSVYAAVQETRRRRRRRAARA